MSHAQLIPTIQKTCAADPGSNRKNQSAPKLRLQACHKIIKIVGRSYRRDPTSVPQALLLALFPNFSQILSVNVVVPNGALYGRMKEAVSRLDYNCPSTHHVHGHVRNKAAPHLPFFPSACSTCGDCGGRLLLLGYLRTHDAQTYSCVARSGPKSCSCGAYDLYFTLQEAPPWAPPHLEKSNASSGKDRFKIICLQIDIKYNALNISAKL